MKYSWIEPPSAYDSLEVWGQHIERLEGLLREDPDDEGAEASLSYARLWIAHLRSDEAGGRILTSPEIPAK